MTPEKFAESIRAKLTLPSDPHPPRDIFAKTDVTKTWERFRNPEPKQLRRAK